jgi:GxxExxY protein
MPKPHKVQRTQFGSIPRYYLFLRTVSSQFMEKISREELNSYSAIVLDAAIAVHREIGPGLLESIYQHCLLEELRLRGMNTSSNVKIPLTYKNMQLKKEFVIDILIEQEIILELKAVEEILPIHEAQLLSYLKLTNKRLGLLINFNVPLLKQGFKRMVNKF